MQQQLLLGKRIFIVEDDVTNMAVFAYALKNQGAVVIQDPWNASTISLMRRYLPVDIVLLDLMLRYGNDGYDIFDRIQGDPELMHIPVLAVSASDPEIEIPRVRAKGFVGFIPKPISVRDFPAQIASCLSGQELWVASPRQDT